MDGYTLKAVAAIEGLDGGLCCGAKHPGVGPIRKVKTALDKCGFFCCCPSLGPQILQITLLSVANAPRGEGFYFEISSKPESGQPKISRIHHAESTVVDLNDELLELDWWGDEIEVTIHLMRASGHLQSSDVPLALLKIPGYFVRRYANEASGIDSDDDDGLMQSGSRRFAMSAPEESEMAVRKRRFQDILIPGGALAERLTKTIFKRTGEDLGLDMVSPEEMESLRDENRRLRDDHDHLRTQAEHSGITSDEAVVSRQRSRDENAAVLIVHFQLLPKRRAAPEEAEEAADAGFRKASFQLVEGDE